MSTVVMNNFSVTNDILMWRHRMLCPISDFDKIIDSLDTNDIDSRVIKVDMNIRRFVIRTMDKGCIALAIDGSKEEVAEAIERYKEEDKNLPFIERIAKESDAKEFDQFFNNEMSYSDYYHFSCAKHAKLNARVVGELFAKFPKKGYSQMIIEASILVIRGVLDIDKVNECLGLINKESALFIIEKILEKHGVKLKVSNKSSYACKTAVQENIDNSLMFPMFKAVNDVRKLKSSKDISDFNDILNSDLNLKFLKIMYLFDTSRSVKLIVSCFNEMLNEIGKENDKDYSDFKIDSLKQNRYNNAFKSVVYSMKEIICRLKDKAEKTDVEVLAEKVKDKI